MSDIDNLLMDRPTLAKDMRRIEDALVFIYQNGTLDELRAVVSEYRELLREADQLEVNVQVLNEHVSERLNAMVDIGRDDHEKFKLVLDEFPESSRFIVVSGAENHVPNAKAFFQSRLNCFDSYEYTMTVSMATSIIQRSKSPNMFVEILSVLNEDLDTRVHRKAIIKPLLGELVQTLTRLPSSTDELAEKVVTAAGRLIDHLMKNGIPYMYSHLHWLMNTQYKEVGEKLFASGFMEATSVDGYIAAHREYGLSLSSERIYDRLMKKQGIPDLSEFSTMANLKLYLGHVDDYGYIFKHDAATITNLKDSMVQIRTAPIEAAKAFAAGVFVNIQRYGQHRKNVIDIFEALPNGTELLEHVRGHRETSRKMLEIDFDL